MTPPFDSRSAREPLAQGRADTNEIKREIERTRVEMSETLGEIQERLRPDHLIQQAKDTVTGAATGKVRNIMSSAGETATRVADQTRYAGRSVADYATAHPVQIAMIAGAATWWLLRGRDRSYDWEGASDIGYETEYAYGEDRTLRDKAGEYVASARDTVSDYATSARDTVGEYAGAARDSARRASERAREAASTASVRARDTWNRTSTTVDDWVHQNPMAAGALAIAVGAAIGLSAPNSRFEDRTFGERRDMAMERARLKARELKDTVTQRAKNVADTVADITAPSGTPGSTGTTTASGVGVSGTSSSTGRV
jgi:ElaB/YqjD/DUF883 family membrane-anchored ribosome-binding protein